MTDTTSQITTWISDASEALGLFPSVIKSGEAWSPACEEVRARAREAVTRLGEAAMRGAASSPVTSEGQEAETIIRAEVGDACYDDIRWRSTREVVDRCVSAALARAGGDGWRPIAEAPKGREVLVGRWFGPMQNGKWTWTQRVLTNDGLAMAPFTHWAEWPAPPPCPAAPDAEGR